MQPFTTLTGVAAPLLRANIDTGTLIASRFLRSRSFDLGKLLLSDWRYDLDGKPFPEFVLNQPPYDGAKILLAGPNFGCGSSREAAVWALMAFGIRCVIAPNFGEIFYDNAFQNGLLPVEQPEQRVHALAAQLETNPLMTIDLERCAMVAPDGSEIAFTVAEDRRVSMLEGLDETSLVLRHGEEIDAFAARDRLARPWLYARPEPALTEGR
jgi:3-isopropylmalate/(R)-2-methylmalate dehydratase small subunit